MSNVEPLRYWLYVSLPVTFFLGPPGDLAPLVDADSAPACDTLKSQFVSILWADVQNY